MCVQVDMFVPNMVLTESKRNCSTTESQWETQTYTKDFVYYNSLVYDHKSYVVSKNVGSVLLLRTNIILDVMNDPHKKL